MSGREPMTTVVGNENIPTVDAPASTLTAPYCWLQRRAERPALNVVSRKFRDTSNPTNLTTTNRVPGTRRPIGNRDESTERRER